MKRFPDKKIFRYMLYLLAVLPLFLFRDFTLDNELRYLSIADEAIRKGSFFTFTNHGILYADKPPLYLWIVMAGKLLLGYHSLVFLGLFSFIPALVIVYTMSRWVQNALSEKECLSAELLLLTSVYFMGTAIVVRMDMLMCMFIVLALYTFFKIYTSNAKPRDSFLFPFYLFMALFSKGPVGIIIPLVATATFLFLKKDIKSIGNYWGWKTLAILLAFCAIWFAGVFAEAGGQYLNNLVFHQTLNRAVHSFHHQEPFYYYFIAFWYSLAPWSLLCVGILVIGFIKKITITDMELFFLVTVLSSLVILSLFSSKLAVYMVPSFPFLVYLSMLWLKKLGSIRAINLLIFIPAILLSMSLPGLILSQYFDLYNSWLILAAAFILSISGLVAVKLMDYKHLNRAITTMGAGILAAIFTVAMVVPKFNHLIGLGQLCEEAKTIASQNGVAHYYYCKMDRAENLDIYLGVKPEKLTLEDLYRPNSPFKKPAVLFLYDKSIQRNDSLQQYIKGKKIHQSGNYYCVEIDL